VGKKVWIVIFLVALGAGGYFGWTFMRFLVIMRMKVDKIVLEKVGRVPSIQTVASIGDMVKEAARDSHVPEEGMTVTKTIEGRAVGPIVLWYIVIRVTDANGRSISSEQQIENSGMFMDDPEAAVKAGVTISKK
jgi:hypothetical protein